MAGLAGMTGEQIAAWTAGNDQDAVASPSDASPPPADSAPIDAEVTTGATETAQDTPDIETLAQKLAALEAEKAEREAEAERERTAAELAKAERDAKVAEDLRTAERNEFAKNLRELHEVDPEAAKKVAQHRSFLEQDLGYFKHEAQTSANMIDSLSLAMESTLDPEVIQQVIEVAKTLMPYQTYEEKHSFVGQQRQREQTVNEKIKQLEAELEEAKRASVAQQRNPAIDQVERSGGSSGPSGAPGRLGSMTGQQLAEWARNGSNATY